MTPADYKKQIIKISAFKRLMKILGVKLTLTKGTFDCDVKTTLGYNYWNACKLSLNGTILSDWIVALFFISLIWLSGICKINSEIQYSVGAFLHSLSIYYNVAAFHFKTIRMLKTHCHHTWCTRSTSTSHCVETYT